MTEVVNKQGYYYQRAKTMFCLLFQLKVDSVKAKILELIQCWAYAFRENSDYKIVSETFNEMKNSGKHVQGYRRMLNMDIP